jgi:hypothetical protein
MKTPVSRGSSKSGNSPALLQQFLLPAAICCVVAVLAASAQSNFPEQNTNERAVSLVAACSVDSNLQAMVVHQQDAAKKLAQQKEDAALADRKRQLADDSEKLFNLATELQTEVSKTNKDMLSLAVIRKAVEIEHHAAAMKRR